jgi:L-fuconolactonase
VCQLSGLVTEASWDSWTIEQLRRVMFGSDWPVCLLAADYQLVCDAAGKLNGQSQSYGAT